MEKLFRKKESGRFKMEEYNLKSTDYWTIIFGVISLILANLAIFVPQQRLLILSFTIGAVIFTIILNYINKINYNEKELRIIKNKFDKISNQITEKFNYLKEIYNLKVEIEMLKKRGKRAQVNLLDLVKIIVAIILIYVIIQIIKTFFAG